MVKIGIVADDVTGATTVGVLLARSDVRTGIFFDEILAQNYDFKDDLDSIVISSNSRSLPEVEAYDKVKKSTKLLKKMGAEYFSKRIDTTLRGNIGTEIKAMLDVIGNDYLVAIVPAMPASRRILVGGFSIIDNIPLVETDVANDVKTPVTENDIPKLISGQIGERASLIDLSTVLKGEDEISKKIHQEIENNNRILIFDAVTNEHIDAIAKALVKTNINILSVDPGPLTNMLAFNRGLAVDEHSNVPDIKESSNNKNTVIACVGSVTSVTKAQIEHLLEDQRNKVISLDPYKLIERDSKLALNEIKRALDLAIGYLEEETKPRAIVLETALSGKKIDLEKEDKKRGYEKGKCSERINISLGLLVSEIYQNRPEDCVISGIYCTGGDTMLNVCRQMGVSMIEVKDYIIPQVDLSFQVGVNGGLPMVGKGGLTGDIDIVNKIIDRLNLEYNNKEFENEEK